MFFNDNIASLRAECHFHGVCQKVYAMENRLPRLFSRDDFLRCHIDFFSLFVLIPGAEQGISSSCNLGALSRFG